MNSGVRGLLSAEGSMLVAEVEKCDTMVAEG